MRLDRSTHPFDYENYAQSASSFVAKYVAHMAGMEGLELETHDNDVWLEEIYARVTRTLKAVHSSALFAGYVKGEGRDQHANEAEREGALVSALGLRFLGDSTNVSRLHATCSKGVFTRFLEDAVLDKPAERIICHLTCGTCNGHGAHTCGGCHGTGRTRCGYCGGAMRIFSHIDSKGVTHHRQCTACSNGYQKCIGCGGAKQVNCSPCGATGELSRITSFEVRIAEKRIIIGDISKDALAALAGTDLPLYETERPQCQLVTVLETPRGNGHEQLFTFQLPIAQIVVKTKEFEVPVYYAGLAGDVYQASNVLDHLLREPFARLARVCRAAESGLPWRLGHASKTLERGQKTPAVRQALEGIGGQLPNRVRPLTWMFRGIPRPNDLAAVVSATNSTLSEVFLHTTYEAVRGLTTGTKLFCWVLAFALLAYGIYAEHAVHPSGLDAMLAEWMRDGVGWPALAALALVGIPGMVRLWVLAPLGALGKRL